MITLKNALMSAAFIKFIKKMAGVTGIEPIALGFEDRCSAVELHPYDKMIIYK